MPRAESVRDRRRGDRRIPHCGEVSERLKELVSKTSVRFSPYRGFESPPLRFSAFPGWKRGSCMFATQVFQGVRRSATLCGSVGAFTDYHGRHTGMRMDERVEGDFRSLTVAFRSAVFACRYA